MCIVIIIIINIPFNYFFFRFIMQLLCVCFVIDVFVVERTYWWTILIWIALSRYCYACYCWRPSNSVTCLKRQRFPLVTERLSIPFSVCTLAIMAEVLHGFTYPVHAVVWIVSQTLPRSVLLVLSDYCWLFSLPFDAYFPKLWQWPALHGVQR